MERIQRLLSGNLNQEDLLMNQSEKKERREKIEKKVKEINETIQKEMQNIEKIKESLWEAQGKLQNVDTDEPILYWSKNINDKRLKLLGWKSQTKRTIKYKDVPFVDVKLTCMNGNFEEVKRNDAEGIFETKFKSNIGEDGVAIIQIFAMKRNFPDNQRLIRYLKAEISELEGNYQTAEESINSSEAEKEYCTLAIQNLDKVVIDKTKLIFEQDKIRKKIYEIHQILIQTNERDVKYAQIYEQSKHYISNNLNYFKMTKVVNQIVSFNSELINEFLEYYEKYERLLGSNKKISISELSQEENIDKSNIETREMKNSTKGFYCPISKYLMRDPHVNICGHSFEFASIIKFIEENNDCKCPICKKSITKESIVPNNELRQIISDWEMNREIDYINESFLENVLIQNEGEYLKEVENKKNIEENLKQLKLNMQKTEIQLKQSIQRIEKWLKEQKKSKIINTESVSTKPTIPPRQSLDNFNRLSEQSERNSGVNDDEDFSDSSDYEEIANVKKQEEKF